MRHAYHYLPLAVACPTCPGQIGLPCTLGSAYHVGRRTPKLTDQQADRVIDLLLQLKVQRRRQLHEAAADTVRSITVFLDGLTPAEAV